MILMQLTPNFRVDSYSSRCCVVRWLFTGVTFFDSYEHMTQGKVRYDSIAVSFHKFFGYPSVAGLFITGRATFESFRDIFVADMIQLIFRTFL